MLRIRNRAGRQVADALPGTGRPSRAVDGGSVILDADLVACPGGRPDFDAPAPRMLHTGRVARWAVTQVPVTFVAPDVLHVDGSRRRGMAACRSADRSPRPASARGPERRARQHLSARYVAA